MARRLPRAVPVALAAGVTYFLLFWTLSYLRFSGYHTRSYDLAIVVRMLWGIRHGQFHELFTDQPWIAYHFEPILVPFAALDAIFPHVYWLLFAQTAALALAAVPAWRIAERHLGRGLPGVLAVLLYPVLGQVNVFELHPIAFAVAPALWLLDALERGSRRAALISAVVALACREDVLVFVALAMMAVPGPVRRRWRWTAALVCLSGYACYVFVVQPRWGTMGAVQAHFGSLGTTPAMVVGSILRHPLRTLAQVVTPHKLAYVGSLLAPLAFLPLLAPRQALPAVWTIGLNLLSDFPAATRIVDSHYSALAVPALVFAALVGAGRLRRWLPERWPPLVLGASAVVASLVWGAVPGCGGFYREDYAIDGRAAAYDAALAPIQAARDASCSVPISALAHVANRPRPAIFPAGVPNVDFAVADMQSEGLVGTSVARYRAYIAAHVRQAIAAGMQVRMQKGPLVLLAGVLQVRE